MAEARQTQKIAPPAGQSVPPVTDLRTRLEGLSIPRDDGPPAPKPSSRSGARRARRRLPILLPLIAALLIGGGVWTWQDPSRAAPALAAWGAARDRAGGWLTSSDPAPVAPAQTAPAQAATHDPATTPATVAPPPATRLVGSGHVTADRAVLLHPLASGTLTDVTVTTGDAFSAGDVLARVDPEAARHARAAAQARLREAELSHALSEMERARAETLLDRATASARAGTAPARLAEDAAFDLDAATARVALMRQAVASAALDVTEAEAELSRTDVRAPFDGVVLERLVAPGGFVASARDGGPGDGLLRVYDPDRLRIDIELGEARIGDVFVGQTATAELDAWPGHALALEVVAIVPEVSRQKSTITVMLAFRSPPPRARVLPNMAVRVEFDLPEQVSRADLPGRSD